MSVRLCWELEEPKGPKGASYGRSLNNLNDLNSLQFRQEAVFAADSFHVRAKFLPVSGEIKI